jgi:hypothetical protein
LYELITLEKLFTGKNDLEIMLNIQNQEKEIILPSDEAGSYFKLILTQ